MINIEKGSFNDLNKKQENLPINENEVLFNVMRHATKNPEGNLSEEGKKEISKRAKEIIQEIESSSERMIIGFIPSNVGRAKETRDKFEEDVVKHFENKKEYEILDVNQIDEINKAIEQNNKILIRGFAHSSLLGLKFGNGASKEWQRLASGNKIDENLIGKIWVAKPEEIENIRNEVKNKYPNINLKEIKPSNFVDTPEKYASNQLKWMKRILDISRNFTKNPIKLSIKLYGISHNFSTDFAALKLLGKSLDTTTIEESGGGREFLESHQVRIKGGKIYVLFRGMEREFNESELEDIIKNLQEESKQRKEMWKKENL